MDDMEELVKQMIRRAALAESADNAMKFAQAALNATHALETLASTKKIS